MIYNKPESQGIFILFVSWEGHNVEMKEVQVLYRRLVMKFKANKMFGLFQKVEVPKPPIQCLRLKQSCYLTLPYLKPTPSLMLQSINAPLHLLFCKVHRGVGKPFQSLSSSQLRFEKLRFLEEGPLFRPFFLRPPPLRPFLEPANLAHGLSDGLTDQCDTLEL